MATAPLGTSHPKLVRPYCYAGLADARRPIAATGQRAPERLIPLTQSTFASLGLSEAILRALVTQNFTIPTPIQTGAIPALLEGRDLLGVAQTGTGKTAAFALPILQMLAASPSRPKPFCTRVLILAPTRELALQIDAAIKDFSAGQRIFTCAILGGVGRRPQEERMKRGPDIVVGTPGRIKDLMNTRHLRLDEVTHFVLDEADRMLDLGFIKDIRHICSVLPQKRQSLLFSATMPAEVEQLANTLLHHPIKVEITPDVRTPDKIEQIVHFVATAEKRAFLQTLLQDAGMARVIVFTRTKHGADRLANGLEGGGIVVEALHGNKSQSQREKALDRFRSGRARVLVATDIAARGIDVNGITHVVNYDLPVEAESYVHRIGRTARAGAAGVAISLCDRSEYGALRAIERAAKIRLLPDNMSHAGNDEKKPTRPQNRPANKHRNRRTFSAPSRAAA